MTKNQLIEKALKLNILKWKNKNIKTHNKPEIINSILNNQLGQS
jgi:hypothetical protein